MGKTKKFIFTLLTSGMATFLSFLISFLLTPYITKRLGEEAYGFVTLAKNFTSYAALVTVALNSYASRFIGIEYHGGKIKNARGYVSSVLAGDIVLSAIIFLIAVIFDFFIDKILNISIELVSSVKLLFIFVFLSFVFTTIGTVFSSAAYIKNRLYIVGTFRTVSYIVECVAYILLFSLAKPNVWFVGVALFLASIVVFCGNIFVFYKYTPELKPNQNLISLKYIKVLVINGVWNSINGLGNILNSGLDLLVTNLMLSGQDMGQIAITKTISGIVGSFNQLISQPFQPLLLKSYSEGDDKGLLKTLKFSMKISGLFSTLIFVGFFTVGKAFYYLWIPEQNIERIYYLSILSFIYMFFEGPIFPLYYIYTLTVKNKFPCIITVCGGILNVLGMFFLIKYTRLGVYAVVITTLIIMSVISLLSNPIYMARCLKTRWNEFYSVLLRIILSCGALILLFDIVRKYIRIRSWGELLLGTCIISVFIIVLYSFFVFDIQEKKKCAEMIHGKFKKIVEKWQK